MSTALPNPIEYTDFNPKKNSMAENTEGNGKFLQQQVWEVNERYKDGGLWFKDEAELKRQRGIAWEVVKSLGNSILEGKELVSTTLPIHLFEPRSFLERLTDIWAYAPRFLPRAAEFSSDPVERLKYVIAFAVSGLHLLTTARKPFNPLLGETYEASFTDGTDIFVEQTTHHPPSSNWEMIPVDGSYKFWGSCTWSASARANTIKGFQRGPCHIDFPDGARISYSLPDIVIKGVMWGDRVTELVGSMIFTDQKNGIEAEVFFNPEGLGFIRSFFSKAKESTDTIRGEIFKSSSSRKKGENTICNIEGSWLSHLDIDGKRLWDIKMVPDGCLANPNPLPSDCRNRADLKALKEGDLERAKEAKVALEDRQRLEKKLRQKGVGDGASPVVITKEKKSKKSKEGKESKEHKEHKEHKESKEGK